MHACWHVVLHFPDVEDVVLMGGLVQRQLSCLSEGSSAAIMVTFEWLLLGVDVCVLLQVLCQCEGLEAKTANMLLD